MSICFPVGGRDYNKKTLTPHYLPVYLSYKFYFMEKFRPVFSDAGPGESQLVKSSSRFCKMLPDNRLCHNSLLSEILIYIVPILEKRTKSPSSTVFVERSVPALNSVYVIQIIVLSGVVEPVQQTMSLDSRLLISF